jgi:hypothetical protein
VDENLQLSGNKVIKLQKKKKELHRIVWYLWATK